MSHIVERFGEKIDLSKERKIRCPSCAEQGNDKSGNNLHVYGLDKDGEHLGCRCFSCNFVIPSVKWERENIKKKYDYEKEASMGLEFNSEVLESIKKEYSVLKTEYRSIRPDIYKFYRVLHKIENGVPLEQIYPTYKNEDIVGFKRRELPKKFLTPYGETGADVNLFGQQLFLTSTSRDVLIVGGEIDAMSAYQMLKDYRDRTNARKDQDFPYVPVVSSTIGESGLFKQAQRQYDWLNRFERIIVCLDSDKAGKEAVELLVKNIPKNKLYVMELDKNSKDPNEYLKAGNEAEFIGAYYKAHPYVPVGVKGSSSLMDDIIQNALIEKIPLPPYMHKLQKMMAGGIPLGVIVNLISSSGTGKSTHVEEIIYHWIFNSPYLCGILSLESDSGEYGTKILSRHIGRKINLIESVQEKLEYLNSDYVQKKQRELFFSPNGMDRFILMDERDGNVDAVKKTVEKMIIECGCKIIVTDPLQDLIACLPDDEQNKFMSWQKGLVKSHKVTFFNVNHTKKSLNGGGSGSQGSDLAEEDTHGSSSIYKSGACNLLFSRNKEAEDIVERNTTIMKMPKCRWTGNTSPYAGKYYYDNETHTVYDYEDYWKNRVKPIDPNKDF